MNKQDLYLLIEVLRTNKGFHPLKCVVTWNGFEAGQTYQALYKNDNEVQASDKDGIVTPIGIHACTFFELAGHLPTAEEKAAERKAQTVAKLRDLGPHLTSEYQSYGVGQIVEWIPGMCNRNLPSKNAPMYVVEQTSPVLAKQSGEASNPYDIELVDLRVACMATSPREDETCIVEVMVDSRRVQLWATTGTQTTTA